MLLGVFTSMLFLPVLLSIIGPHWKIHKPKTNVQIIAENTEKTTETLLVT